jgi:spermidine synthase
MDTAKTESVRLPFPLALALAGLSGFIALAYELLWTRLFNFASGSRAQAFGAMLGFYLLGLAVGSLLSRRWQRNPKSDGNSKFESVSNFDIRASYLALARLVTVANVAGFLIVPAASWLMVLGTWVRILPLVLVGSALLGILLPLLCHFAIPADEQAGARLSYLYLANILGSGAGSLLTGFVLMDWLTLWQIATLLLVGGLVLAAVLAWRSMAVSRADWALWGLGLALAAAAPRLHDGLWERLQYERDYEPGTRFAQVVESRHGVITVTSNRMVFGNGVYDGAVETQMLPGKGLVRPYFVSALHSRPSEVLVIGLSGGAWTQILAHNPHVERVTAVEISGACFKVIRAWPEVSSVLTNPKVEIVIDDGRRWLRRNPDRRFDAILMNTTFHWREFASALLSKEFLEMCKAHLKPGGFVMWNCTGSYRAARTGLEVFPYTMMVVNNCVGSLTPLEPDKERWRAVLASYRIDGQPVFDLTTPEGRRTLVEVVAFMDRGRDVEKWRTMGREEMEETCRRAEIITDDNLGHEYQSSLRTFLASLVPGLNWLFARIF